MQVHILSFADRQVRTAFDTIIIAQFPQKDNCSGNIFLGLFEFSLYLIDRIAFWGYNEVGVLRRLPFTMISERNIHMKPRIPAFLLALLMTLTFVFTACGEESLDPDDGWYPAGYQLASNKNLDYSLFVPETWNVDMSTGVLTASTTGGNISMVVTAVESGTTLADFWKTYETQFDPAFVDFTYEVEAQAMLLDSGKVPANKYIYTATVTGNAYKFMQVVAILGEAAYIFTFTALAEKYDDLIEQVNGSVSYLRFDAAKTPADSE